MPAEPEPQDHVAPGDRVERAGIGGGRGGGAASRRDGQDEQAGEASSHESMVFRRRGNPRAEPQGAYVFLARAAARARLSFILNFTISAIRPYGTGVSNGN